MTVTTTRYLSYYIAITLLSVFFNDSLASIPDDKIDNCEELAKEGQCSTNANYMSENCQMTCSKWISQQEKTDYFTIDHDIDITFYHLGAHTAPEGFLNFEMFEDYVTIVVNLPKLCSTALPTYTAVEKYFSAIESLSEASPYAIEIVVFPFFKSGVDYKNEDCFLFDRAAKKKHRKIHITTTVEINGFDAHPLYKYMKEKAGLDALDEEHSTFFLVNAAGTRVDYFTGTTLSRFKTLLKARLYDSGDL